MKKIILRILFSVLMLCIISSAGCSFRKDTADKSEKRNPTELMTELEDAVKKGDYEAFKELFIFNTGEKYSKEDFEELKKFMESKGESNTYFAYSYFDKRMAVFKMDSSGGQYYISSFAKIPQSLYMHIMGIVEPRPLESDNPVKDNIALILANTEYINSVTWSPDESCVAFRRMDMMNECVQIYLWKVGSRQPVHITGIEPSAGGFSWSPDSRCVIADTGTYVIRGGYLISAEDCKLIKDFEFIEPICWSIDSKMFAAASVSKSVPKGFKDFVSDIVVFNALTGNQSIVAGATEDFYLNAIKWNKDGTILYRRTWIETNKMEVLSYKYQ